MPSSPTLSREEKREIAYRCFRKQGYSRTDAQRLAIEIEEDERRERTRAGRGTYTGAAEYTPTYDNHYGYGYYAAPAPAGAGRPTGGDRGGYEERGRGHQPRSEPPYADPLPNFTGYYTETRVPSWAEERPSGTYYHTEEHRPGGFAGYPGTGYAGERTYTNRPRNPHGRTPRPQEDAGRRQSNRGHSHRPRANEEEFVGGIKPDVDFYRVLEISKVATPDEIKKAFRKLSLKYHPDRCPPEQKEEATGRMASINRAHDVLSDPKQRELYDRTGMI